MPIWVIVPAVKLALLVDSAAWVGEPSWRGPVGRVGRDAIRDQLVSVPALAFGAQTPP